MSAPKKQACQHNNNVRTNNQHTTKQTIIPPVPKKIGITEGFLKACTTLDESHSIHNRVHCLLTANSMAKIKPISSASKTDTCPTLLKSKMVYSLDTYQKEQFGNRYCRFPECSKKLNSFRCW